MIRVAIVDDEPNALSTIEEFIQGMPDFEICLATTNPELILIAARKKEIDVLIADINMPEMDGVILSEIVRKLNVLVIICSAHPDRALECIETQVIDFVVKPPSKLKIYRGLHKAKERLDLLADDNSEKLSEEFLLVSKYGDRKLHKLLITDIIFVEQKSNYAIIHVQNEEIVHRTPFSKLFEFLKWYGFIRSHKSFAFNIKFFQKMVPKQIFLTNGTAIPIGRTFETTIQQKIKENLGDGVS